MRTPEEPCGVHATPSTSRIRISHVDADTGVGAFATRSYAPGESILREAPYVFAQSYRTWKTTPLLHVDDTTGSNGNNRREDGCAAEGSSSSSSSDEESRCSFVEEERTAALRTVRCCFGCGAPLPYSVEEECVRLDRLVQMRQSADRGAEGAVHSSEVPLWDLLHTTGTTCYMHDHGGSSKDTEPSPHAPHYKNTDSALRAHVTEVDVAGGVHVVHFCDPTCEVRALETDGKRFVLSPLSATAQQTLASVRTADSGRAALCYPTHDTILHTARHPTTAATRSAVWPTRLAVLSTLHSVARRCNERVWLLVLLLAKELHYTLRSAPPPPSRATTDTPDVGAMFPWVADTVAVSFRARLENLCARYAEGAMEPLTSEQRALLRFSWQLLTWWWVLCVCDVAADATAVESAMAEEMLCGVLHVAECVAFPVQLYLQLCWLTNANAHMYVVASPVYTLWCRWIAESSECVDAAVDDGGASRKELFARLYTLFHGADVWSARLTQGSSTSSSSACAMSDVLHGTGVALYDVATKLNHSCAPNVCFQPNAGAVAASVVALRAIAVGDELLTSYVRPEIFEDEVSVMQGEGCTDSRTRCALAAQRRRRFLEVHYGFSCCCSRCTAELENEGEGESL